MCCDDCEYYCSEHGCDTLWLLCVQMEGLEDELKCLRETGAGGGFQPLPLPEGMPASSADVIAGLNEHLIVALQVLFLLY